MKLKRTTISIPTELLKRTLEISGKKKLSEAVVTSLGDYVDMKDRLAFIDKLQSRPLPHSWRKIKQARNRLPWSS